MPTIKLILFTFFTILFTVILPSSIARLFSENKLIKELLESIIPLLFFLIYTYRNRKNLLNFQPTLIYRKTLWTLLIIPLFIAFLKNPITNFELNTFFYVLMISTTIGITEELIFRGILFRKFQKSKFPVYLLISAILFGVLHYNQGVIGIISATIGGLIYGLSRISGFPLLLLIICHSATDFPMMWMKYGNHPEEVIKNTTLSGIINLSSILFFLIVLFIVIKFLFKTEHWTNEFNKITTGNTV
ncbi:CAAX prenyl protease-like protein [Maribacter vaceletii]|uniref:CAAX prenyl protease-like protein n=1 Tax=Maribacter vaceletii TaxID=1206816 RepID=A0A495E6E9_9FLAO|nr:CPBP family intramembrane glutamic endopeptidase [Maribacter vaceletii]RKR12490.1 CAAX prenyl protease-like protein [Maribacter vaceletii]